MIVNLIAIFHNKEYYTEKPIWVLEKIFKLFAKVFQQILKIYNYKFQGLSEAKVAATFCSEALGKKIIKFNIRSLNISIGQCGSVAIHLKFETSLDLKNFEDNSQDFFSDLKKTFVYKESNFSGVFIYNYESEITSTDLNIN